MEPATHYCHQCRGRRTGLAVQCRDNHRCKLKYCGACLRKYYGENAIQALAVPDWKCPKCQKNCQCSTCRPKRGLQPLGRTKKDSLIFEQPGDDDAIASDEMEIDASEASAFTSTTRPQTPEHAHEVPLPQGSPVESVASIPMPASDVGHAFQFLQFCRTFGQVFDLDQDDPQKLLKSLFYYERQEENQPLIIQFQKKLITFLRKDGRRRTPSTWLEEVERCIWDFRYPFPTLLLKKSNITEDEYDELEPSSKLRVLNFLCDEVLSSDVVRTIIKNAELSLEKKPPMNSSPEVATETGEMGLDKEETPAADLTTLEAVAGVTTKEESEVNVIRLEPSCTTDSGNKFWNFGSSPSHLRVYMQDIGQGCDALDSIDDRWIKFELEQKELVECFISSVSESKTSNRSTQCSSLLVHMKRLS